MIHHSHFKSFGDGAYLTTIMGGGSRLHPRFAGHNPEDDLFHMDGPAVLRMVRGIAHEFLDELYPGLVEKHGGCGCGRAASGEQGGFDDVGAFWLEGR
jgi:hypothetical protein